MTDQFDAHYEWLGIPPKDQPPNHYRLLGIELFEQNLNVIERAADRQMSHVRSFQSGRHVKQSQQLLNELAAAKGCLLIHNASPITIASCNRILRPLLTPISVWTRQKYLVYHQEFRNRFPKRFPFKS